MIERARGHERNRVAMRNRAGLTLSIPLVRSIRPVALLALSACSACTASMRPENAAQVYPSSKVEDEFAFIVNPMAHVIAAADAAREPEVVVVDPRPRRERLSLSPGLDGQPRASMLGTSLDYAAIPLAAEAKATSQFALSKRAVSPACPATHEARVRDEWWLTGNLGLQSVIRVDGLQLPPVAMLAKGRFEDTYGELVRLNEPRLSSAEWTSVELPVVGDAMSVTTFDGSFDSTMLIGIAKRSYSVEATEIVPRELYAYRICEEGCLLPAGDPARVERLAIVGPPAVWLGSAGPSTEARFDGDQPFTLLATRVWRGGSASLVIDYTLEAAKRAQNETVSRADALALPFDVTSVMIDVVWPEGEPAPALTLYRGRFAREVAPRTSKRTSYAGNDCYERSALRLPDPAVSGPRYY